MEQSGNKAMKKPANRQGPVWLIGIMVMGAAMILVAAVGLLLAGRPQQRESKRASGPLRAGMRVDDFAFSDLRGNTVRLADYRGRPVLINSWATWCPPCKREMPDLETFYQQQRQSGFVVLAINAGETREQAAAFALEVGLSFPVLLDPEERFTGRYGINDFPTSILVGADGLVKAVHVGLITPEQLEREILPLIQ